MPHFHHEVVYEGVVLVLENGSEQCAEMISTLLQYMGHIGILSYDQLNQVRNLLPKLMSKTLMFSLTVVHRLVVITHWFYHSCRASCVCLMTYMT